MGLLTCRARRQTGDLHQEEVTLESPNLTLQPQYLYPLMELLSLEHLMEAVALPLYPFMEGVQVPLPLEYLMEGLFPLSLLIQLVHLTLLLSHISMEKVLLTMREVCTHHLIIPHQLVSIIHHQVVSIIHHQAVSLINHQV